MKKRTTVSTSQPHTYNSKYEFLCMMHNRFRMEMQSHEWDAWHFEKKMEKKHINNKQRARDERTETKPRHSMPICYWFDALVRERWICLHLMCIKCTVLNKLYLCDGPIDYIGIFFILKQRYLSPMVKSEIHFIVFCFESLSICLWCSEREKNVSNKLLHSLKMNTTSFYYISRQQNNGIWCILVVWV